jgi:hypothetical protein
MGNVLRREAAQRRMYTAPLSGAFYLLCYARKKNKGLAFLRALVLYGAGTRSRTRDLLITSQLLYQLSYTGVVGADYRDLIWRVKP